MKFNLLTALFCMAASFLCAAGAPAHAQWFEIKPAHSGKCLDASATNEGANVHQYTCHGRDNQQWRWDDQGRLVEKMTGMCLDDAGNGNVHLWTCHGASNQKWTLDSKSRLVGGREGKCLDVDRASNDDKANAMMWACHDGPNQKWTLAQSGFIIHGVKAISVSTGRAWPADSEFARYAGKVESIRTVGALPLKITTLATRGDISKTLNSWSDSIAYGTGSDDLYIKVNGSKIWPGDRYSSIDVGDLLEVNYSGKLDKDATISLWEWDLISDDDLGSATISKNLAPGAYTATVISTSEGSSYEVYFSVY